MPTKKRIKRVGQLLRAMGKVNSLIGIHPTGRSLTFTLIIEVTHLS
jgi:hypothetical protein